MAFLVVIVSNSIAFLSVIYPIEDQYIVDCLLSLESQTVSGFDVILVNDGYQEFQALYHRFPELNIIEIETKGNIADNRAELIRVALEDKYDYAIFGDIDDVFSKNRVQTSVLALKNYDIVVNELLCFRGNDFDSEGVIESRYSEGSELSLGDVLEKNLFGLSNTAIRLEGMNADFAIFPQDLAVIDWYFYSKLLLHGMRAIFTAQTVTFYRQHETNVAGLRSSRINHISRSIQVKKKHYGYLRTESDIFQPLYENTLRLEEFCQDPSNLAELALFNEKNVPHPLWWEVIYQENIK